MNYTRSRKLLAAGTSLLALAVTPVHADESDNVPGIASRARAEGADYVSVLKVPQGVSHVFGGEVVSERGTAIAVVKNSRGERGGAIVQSAVVEDGDGGATLVNSGNVVVQALANASSERPHKDVLSGAYIRYAVFQGVKVDDGHSVDLTIINNGSLSANASATSVPALGENGSRAHHAAVAFIRSGTLQHAIPGEVGSGSVSLENAATGSLAFSANAAVGAPEDAEGRPARRSTAVAVLLEPVNQRAWGVDASASLHNAGAVANTANASSVDAEHAGALAAVVRGAAQEANAEADGRAVVENSGTLRARATATAAGSRRADAIGAVLQGIAQDVHAGANGIARVANSGTISSEATAAASADNRTRATAAIGQVIGQHVASSQSTASIVNSGLLQGSAIANANSGQADADLPRDRAVALATIGAPRGGLRLPAPAFGQAPLEELLLEVEGNRNDDGHKYDSKGSDDDGHGHDEPVVP